MLIRLYLMVRPVHMLVVIGDVLINRDLDLQQLTVLKERVLTLQLLSMEVTMMKPSINGQLLPIMR